MKNTLTIVALAAGILPAYATQLELPDTNTNPPQTSERWGNVTEALEKAGDMTYGYYVGACGGEITRNWHTPSITEGDVTRHEGDFINTNNVGQLILAGRSGTSGLVAAFVYGSEITTGTQINSLTFSASGNTNNTLEGTITLGLSVYDSAGTQVAGFTPVTNVSFQSNSNDVTTATLNFGEAGLSWQNGYKVVAVIKGLSGTATTAYQINNIQAAYVAQSVPEPTTATLSLLALAGLTSRRRRR